MEEKKSVFNHHLLQMLFRISVTRFDDIKTLAEKNYPKLIQKVLFLVPFCDIFCSLQKNNCFKQKGGLQIVRVFNIFRAISCHTVAAQLERRFRFDPIKPANPLDCKKRANPKQSRFLILRPPDLL
jgi:hypothetical protein